jgi:hypothetical protein
MTETEGIANYKRYLERRIIFYKKTVENIEAKHGPNPASKYNYHGGEEIGYWKGMLAHAENTLDKLEEELNGKSTQNNTLLD